MSVEVFVDGVRKEPEDGECFAITETLPTLPEGVPYLGLAVTPQGKSVQRKAWQITISCCGDMTADEIRSLEEQLRYPSPFHVALTEIVRRAKVRLAGDDR